MSWSLPEHVSAAAGANERRPRLPERTVGTVHVRPLKSVTVVILGTGGGAVSDRLVCVRGESFPETAVIEEKCN